MEENLEVELNSSLRRTNDLIKDMKHEIQCALEITKKNSLQATPLDLSSVQSVIKQLRLDHEDIEFKFQQLESACTTFTVSRPKGNYRSTVEYEEPSFEDETSHPSSYFASIESGEAQNEAAPEEASVTRSLYAAIADDDTPFHMVPDTPAESHVVQEKHAKVQQDEGELSAWDKQFMRIRNGLDEADEVILAEKCQKVVDLADHFFNAASDFARFIVAEQHCDNQDKKIKSLDVGGVAGGTKYSVHGLFFKYPVDTCIDKRSGSWLYGGSSPNDSRAAKASNHDLKGLTYLMIADKKLNFNFPLLGLIDYQGFRLTVMTTLPISDKTLVYGSKDGGYTMNSDPQVHESMKEIAAQLNLCLHMVSSENPTEMALCGDIEIHKLKNEITSEDLFFALDLARVFPPAAPQSGSPTGSIFFRMLRPELILKCGTPLSSDALSAWQEVDPEAPAMNRNIFKAMDILHEQVVAFGRELCDEKVNARYIKTAFADAKHMNFNGIPIKDAIVRDLHQRGINMRYLGMLVVEMNGKNTKMINFLLSLITVRAIKNIWRRKMLKTKGTGQRIYEECFKKNRKSAKFIPGYRFNTGTKILE